MVRLLGGIALFFLSFAWAETFSSKGLKTVNLSENSKIQTSVNDSLCVKIPSDRKYICGIELNMKIPKEIASKSNFVEWAIYENVKPKGKSLSGEKIFSSMLPQSLSLNVYIPLSDDFSIKESPYAEKVPIQSEFGDGQVFLRFKKIKNEPANEKINLEVKPVFSDKGMLHLTVETANEAEIPSLRKSAKKGDGNYAVFVDDKPLEDAGDVLLIEGEHHASIVSDSFRNEIRSFIIEKAKTTNLTVELRRIEPTLIFICPQNTEIYFDGVKIENPRRAFLIDAGDHMARMVLSDYEIVKTFTASYGKSYTMSLDIDATIREER